ncbi:hypothetical protein CU098_004481 [Rhizopus stolonifer]|uniref:DUF8032 domain-containing protein n=1 Tax=Rhizopus stolonifer TaxID=4846 RepID=A0A367JTB3_RHIST|nr:hypothetical protein CU098_004481 [Rhizopus stolonifer]
MDFCTTPIEMLHSPTSLSIQDLITAPAKAEFLLELLTSDQIHAIEQTLCKVKRRRLDKEQQVPVHEPKVADKPVQPTVKVNTTPNEPITEIRDGIEWVSFVYSHNRTMKRYSIRTDLQQIDTTLIDDKFKSDNCVYPRANLPKEEYTGNRWAYETECNVLGWKLAWLNKDEIAGKRGLIQRAVDSYRNRYPSMRSRRVARQEKLLNGTLRKRKHRDGDEHHSNNTSDNQESTSSPLSGMQSAHHPKTIAIEDTNNQRFRIKINVESVDLEEINIEFRKANCPYPRAMNMPKPATNNTRWVEETMCNELAWKLAWLNPRHLAGKKNMLQRALDIYRSKFMPSLQPRKNSKRVAPIPPPSLTNTTNQQTTLMNLLSSSKNNNVPLTADALSAQNAMFEKKASSTLHSPVMSSTSGTTESLDFNDCFSLAEEESTKNDVKAAIFCDALLQEPLSTSSGSTDVPGLRMNSTSSYGTNSAACTPSPSTTLATDPFNNDFFDQFIMPTDDDPFYSTMFSDIANTSDAEQLSKLYNTPIEDTFNAGNLLDPLF